MPLEPQPPAAALIHENAGRQKVTRAPRHTRIILAASSSTRHRSMPDIWLHTLKAAFALCTARSTSFSPEHSSLAITRPGHILSRKQRRCSCQRKGTENTIYLAAKISVPPPAPGYERNGSKQNPLICDWFLEEVLWFKGLALRPFSHTHIPVTS